MELSSYHQQYTDRSDQEIQKRADVKREELFQIFDKLSFATHVDPVRVAVLGCGDKRFVAHHQRIFEDLLHKNISMTTFDISTEHLDGLENIVSHDVTQTLPNVPYDIVYAHVFLKFIEKEKQWDVLKNAYDALATSGCAIFIFDPLELNSAETTLSDGLFAVPLDELEKQLTENGIDFKIISLQIENILSKPFKSTALVLIK